VHLTDIKKERVQMLITGYKIDRCVEKAVRKRKKNIFLVFGMTSERRQAGVHILIDGRRLDASRNAPKGKTN
jgi:hypothetical protein